MSEHDPIDLAARRERETDEMQRGVDELAARVEQTREDWERKRADDDVPGAQPPAAQREAGDEPQPSSPAPQAPPVQEGPADAEATSEGATGPPADTLEHD